MFVSTPSPVSLRQPFDPLGFPEVGHWLCVPALPRVCLFEKQGLRDTCYPSDRSSTLIELQSLLSDLIGLGQGRTLVDFCGLARRPSPTRKSRASRKPCLRQNKVTLRS